MSKHNPSINKHILGTDPPNQIITQQFFGAPGTKKLISPPEQTKSPDNSNMFHIFNNNTCTNFRTA